MGKITAELDTRNVTIEARHNDENWMAPSYRTKRIITMAFEGGAECFDLIKDFTGGRINVEVEFDLLHGIPTKELMSKRYRMILEVIEEPTIEINT